LFSLILDWKEERDYEEQPPSADTTTDHNGQPPQPLPLQLNTPSNSNTSSPKITSSCHVTSPRSTTDSIETQLRAIWNGEDGLQESTPVVDFYTEHIPTEMPCDAKRSSTLQEILSDCDTEKETRMGVICHGFQYSQTSRTFSEDRTLKRLVLSDIPTSHDLNSKETSPVPDSILSSSNSVESLSNIAFQPNRNLDVVGGKLLDRSGDSNLHIQEKTHADDFVNALFENQLDQKNKSESPVDESSSKQSNKSSTTTADETLNLVPPIFEQPIGNPSRGSDSSKTVHQDLMNDSQHTDSTVNDKTSRYPLVSGCVDYSVSERNHHKVADDVLYTVSSEANNVDTYKVEITKSLESDEVTPRKGPRTPDYSPPNHLLTLDSRNTDEEFLNCKKPRHPQLAEQASDESEVLEKGLPWPDGSGEIKCPLEEKIDKVSVEANLQAENGCVASAISRPFQTSNCCDITGKEDKNINERESIPSENNALFVSQVSQGGNQNSSVSESVKNVVESNDATDRTNDVTMEDHFPCSNFHAGENLPKAFEDYAKLGVELEVVKRSAINKPIDDFEESQACVISVKNEFQISNAAEVQENDKMEVFYDANNVSRSELNMSENNSGCMEPEVVISATPPNGKETGVNCEPSHKESTSTEKADSNHEEEMPKDECEIVSTTQIMPCIETPVDCSLKNLEKLDKNNLIRNKISMHSVSPTETTIDTPWCEESMDVTDGSIQNCAGTPQIHGENIILDGRDCEMKPLRIIYDLVNKQVDEIESDKTLDTSPFVKLNNHEGGIYEKELAVINNIPGNDRSHEGFLIANADMPIDNVSHSAEDVTIEKPAAVMDSVIKQSLNKECSEENVPSSFEGEIVEVETSCSELADVETDLDFSVGGNEFEEEYILVSEDGEVMDEGMLLQVVDDDELSQNEVLETTTKADLESHLIDVCNIPLPPGDAPVQNCFDIAKWRKIQCGLEDRCDSPFISESLDLYRNPSPPSTPRLVQSPQPALSVATCPANGQAKGDNTLLTPDDVVPDDAHFQDVMENCLANAKRFLTRVSPDIDVMSSKDVLLTSYEAASDTEKSQCPSPIHLSPLHSGIAPEQLPVDNWPYLEEEVPLSPQWRILDEEVPIIEENQTQLQDEKLDDPRLPKFLCTERSRNELNILIGRADSGLPSVEDTVMNDESNQNLMPPNYKSNKWQPKVVLSPLPESEICINIDNKLVSEEISDEKTLSTHKVELKAVRTPSHRTEKKQKSISKKSPLKKSDELLDTCPIQRSIQSCGEFKKVIVPYETCRDEKLSTKVRVAAKPIIQLVEFLNLSCSNLNRQKVLSNRRSPNPLRNKRHSSFIDGKNHQANECNQRNLLSLDSGCRRRRIKSAGDLDNPQCPPTFFKETLVNSKRKRVDLTKPSTLIEENVAVSEKQYNGKAKIDDSKTVIEGAHLKTKSLNQLKIAEPSPRSKGGGTSLKAAIDTDFRLGNTPPLQLLQQKSPSHARGILNKSNAVNMVKDLGEKKRNIQCERQSESDLKRNEVEIRSQPSLNAEKPSDPRKRHHRNHQATKTDRVAHSILGDVSEIECKSKKNDISCDKKSAKSWRCSVCGFSDITLQQTHVQEHAFHCQSCHLAFKTEVSIVIINLLLITSILPAPISLRF